MNQPFSIGDSFTTEGVSERVYINTQLNKHTVFTSRTLPLAGQKASEAAFTDSTEEKESLLYNHHIIYTQQQFHFQPQAIQCKQYHQESVEHNQ